VLIQLLAAKPNKSIIIICHVNQILAPGSFDHMFTLADLSADKLHQQSFQWANSIIRTCRRKVYSYAPTNIFVSPPVWTAL